MQQVRQRIFDNLLPQCIGKNQTFFACLQQNCCENAFMCQNVKCLCFQKHNKCVINRISTIFESIEGQKQPIDQQTQKSFKKIENIYDDAIEKLSQYRAQFLDSIFYFGLKPYSIKFVLQLQTNPTQIKGQFMHKLHQQLQIKDIQIKIQTEKLIEHKVPEIKRLIYNMNTKIKNFTFQQKKGFQYTSKILKQKNQVFLLSMFNSEVTKLSLLYRASQNNFSAQKFRKDTDNQNCTLTLIQTQNGKIIGGYTPLRWQNTKEQKCLQDLQKESFLFSLTQKQKYQIKDITKTIINHQTLGPCFGTDLRIVDKCNNGLRCETDFPRYYSNTKQQKKPKSYLSFTGSNGKFNVTQYEVFKVHFKKNIVQKAKEQKQEDSNTNIIREFGFNNEYIDYLDDSF